jgi:hypothetical protein
MQSTPLNSITNNQGSSPLQEKPMTTDSMDLERSTSTSTPANDQEQHSGDSRRMNNLRNVKRVLEEIGRGKSPTSTIVDGTSPRYWIIRTGREGYQDENNEDRWSLLHDQISKDHHELWTKRGGTGSGLRFGADLSDESFIGHVAVRLVDAKSGNSCLGINFMARLEQQPGKSKNESEGDLNEDNTERGRRFMLVEDELSRNPEKLLKQLRRRKIAGTGSRLFNIKGLKTLLNEAPTLIVMPEVDIDPAFWDEQALRKKDRNREALEKARHLDRDYSFDE